MSEQAERVMPRGVGRLFPRTTDVTQQGQDTMSRVWRPGASKNKSWGKIKGRKIKLLKHFVFASYSIPIIFSKIFSLAITLARLRFMLQLEIQACNVPHQPNLYFFNFLVSLSLTASFQNSLKIRIKLHTIAYKMSKNCLRGWRGWRKKRGRETWSRMAVGGIDAPGDDQGLIYPAYRHWRACRSEIRAWNNWQWFIIAVTRSLYMSNVKSEKVDGAIGGGGSWGCCKLPQHG